MDFSAVTNGRTGSAFERHGVERAWTRTRGGQVVIGIVDHGTQAEYSLSAHDFGAPEAKLLTVRVGNGADAQAPDIAHAIEYAAEMGASIINLSNGCDLGAPAQLRAVQYAAARNVLVVCGACGAPDAPGPEVDDPIPNVIKVASADAQDAGTHPKRAEIAAPAPYVAGCAALVKALNPGWGYHEIKEHLLASANPANRLLDVASAVIGPLQLDCAPEEQWSSLNDAQVRWSLRYRSAYCTQVSVLYKSRGDEHWRELAAGRAGSLMLTVPSEAMRRSTGTMRLACRESNFYADEVKLTIL
jgi:hypothetical protein